MADVWHDIRLKLGFNFSFIKSDTWGSLDEDGRWTGMVGHVTEGKAQIALGDFYHTASRAPVIDYSHFLQSARKVTIPNLNDTGFLLLLTTRSTSRKYLNICQFVLLEMGFSSPQYPNKPLLRFRMAREETDAYNRLYDTIFSPRTSKPQ